MKKLVFVLALLCAAISLGLIPIYADDRTQGPVRRAPKKAPPPQEMIMIVKPDGRFTNRWCFVIDASSSIWYKPGRGTVARLRQAFTNATIYSSDELWFCVYKFSDAGAEEYKGWAKGTPKDLKEAEIWINKSRGTYSYGNKSIRLALRKKVKNLTIIIITDGGFTSACNRGIKGDFSTIAKTIVDGQKWRVKKGYGAAMICTIGIENKDYFGGGKPDDKYCQEFLQKIGTEHKGGYFLVRKK